MKAKSIIPLLSIILLAILGGARSKTVWPQMDMGHGHNYGHGAWRDTSNVVELAGSALVDSTSFHPVYYIDTDGDGTAD